MRISTVFKPCKQHYFVVLKHVKIRKNASKMQVNTKSFLHRQGKNITQIVPIFNEITSFIH
jgi:hypothetical protein